MRLDIAFSPRYDTASILNQKPPSNLSVGVAFWHCICYLALGTQCTVFHVFFRRELFLEDCLPRAGVFERRSALVLIWRDTPDFVLHGLARRIAVQPSAPLP